MKLYYFIKPNVTFTGHKINKHTIDTFQQYTLNMTTTNMSSLFTRYHVVLLFLVYRYVISNNFSSIFTKDLINTFSKTNVTL